MTVKSDSYSVPQEAKLLFEEGILRNTLIKGLPAQFNELSQYVEFVGSPSPSIPINWRFAESISALKAFEATMLNTLIVQKYKVQPAKVMIDTDHASLFFMSPLLAQIIKDGKPEPFTFINLKMEKLFPNTDKYHTTSSPLKWLATNIYKTKDGRFYHTHGSMNPAPTLTALKLPVEGDPLQEQQEAIEVLQEAVSKFDSEELDKLINDQYRQAGTIAWTSKEYFASDHGQQSGKVGLYEVIEVPNSAQLPCWWPTTDNSTATPERPLTGLKIVDLTRIIAAPTIARSLAEMGASVMRITSPNVTDMYGLHPDLNWGKWNCHLDLKQEKDKEKLWALISEADIVVDGYRPGVMERLGFGRQAIFDKMKQRQRGIIHVGENCYGWHGPWSYRSGWQQISDACCGISRSYSQAMGMDEAVTPVFPNSDYCTGVAGCTAVLHALINRAEKGGSWGIDVALNYYSQWLARTCGTYNEKVWHHLWKRHGSPVFRHYHSMAHLLPAMLKLLKEHDNETLFKPEFFEPRRAEYLDATFIQVKPIAQFEDGKVKLGYHVGTRGNGVDQPRWPKDLGVEVVTEDN